MLVLAYVSQMMMTAFGQRWLVGGKLNVRFKDPARPGDTIIVNGKISKLENNDGQTIIHCSVLCSSEKGDSIITGEATLAVKNDGDS
ncbi:hypothetical protein ES703_58630 [subsurface metagenome]